MLDDEDVMLVDDEDCDVIEADENEFVSHLAHKDVVSKHKRKETVIRRQALDMPSKIISKSGAVPSSKTSAKAIKKVPLKLDENENFIDSDNEVKKGRKRTHDEAAPSKRKTAPKTAPAPSNTLLQRLGENAKKSSTTSAKGVKNEPPPSHDHASDESEYAMEIRTARPDNVKKVIEIISPLLTDAVIRFQKDGIYIFAMDAVKVAFVSVHLKSEHFEFYALKQPFDIGVDTSNLNKVLSSVQKFDSLSFIFDTEETSKNLQLVMESTSRNEIFIATIYGIDPKIHNYEIPDQRYESVMTLPAATFQSHIHSLSQLSPIVTFKTDNKVFVMEIRAEFGEAQEIIKPCENSMKFIKNNERREEAVLKSEFQAIDENSENQIPDGSQNDEVEVMEDEKPEDEEAGQAIKRQKVERSTTSKPAQSRRSFYRSNKHRHKVQFEGPVVSATHIMKYLKVFCKATPLSRFVYIYFEKDEPLVLSYDIRGLGTLIYCICDVSERNNDGGEQEDE